jgi:ribosomal protein L44E
MPNRTLTEDERKNLFLPLIEEVRNRLEELSKGDADLSWALRRKLYKTLTYDERDNPTNRRILKQVKRALQKNKCATCGKELPEKNAVLDRLEAMKGYTEENIRLICPDCNIRIQEERGYK